LHNAKFGDFSSSIDALIQLLLKLRSENEDCYCWGYHFDWQNRFQLLPKYSPNIICTTFAGHSILDAYELNKNPMLLDVAVSAAEFILTGLNIAEFESGICFSYTKLDRGAVHNANLLGAAYLARVSKACNDKKYLPYAQRAIEYSVSRQASDGSWPYGEHATQQWIDNFHTGYNLTAIQCFCENTGDDRFIEHLKRGYVYWINHFFTKDGLPKYFHDQIYPIDIHSYAQSIVTLITIGGGETDSALLCEQLCKNAIERMQHKKGYFYYQEKKYYKNRIPYMRWSQAWMLYAFAAYMLYHSNR